MFLASPTCGHRLLPIYRPDAKKDGDRIFTAEELLEFDGSDPSKPVYLAVKGVVFDVSERRQMYEPGKGYSVFAGRDASKVCGVLWCSLAATSALNEDVCEIY